MQYKIRQSIRRTSFFFVLFLICFPSFSQQKELRKIRVNEVQVIGSHNSYKIAIEPALLAFLHKRDSASANSLQYEHIPLTQQLDLGLRNLELDVFHDPEGGYYSNPAGLNIVRMAGQTPAPFDAAGKLKQPGMKVFHVQDIDFRSSQLLFKDALQELVSWSLKNPDHTPVFITINTKDGKIPNLRDPLPFDAEALESLDDEIKKNVGADRLITPDLVRRKHRTLQGAILNDGWPTLKKVKGRFLFILDEGNTRSDLYLGKFPGLKNAAMFVNKEEGHPEAAFLILNDPIDNFERIKELVDKGYMVRTRADSDTKEARTGDYTRFEKAKKSGAQVITTDYYVPSNLFLSDYKIVFENGKYERILKHK
ncbi:phosphatidylinositol-specific phospholipase C1-like protein [Haliscomenobacter sp.]|uniref:phosphatidylinositol-specific phospholipase C1-like protein n=1 Tax=Haliscomenobacter sp. TaxID=2717303 RepID=UPI003593B9D7